VIRVGVVGLGLAGQRRARDAAEDHRSELAWVADVDRARADAVAGRYGCMSATDWREVVEAGDVDAVAVATYHKWLSPISVAALDCGKHVLCEKPCGRTTAEVEAIAATAARRRLVAKAGFTLRFHPAIRSAHQLAGSGAIGKPLVVRAVYGHGGRPGYDREWRADADLAGGGELLDQGVHLLDLVRWFLGEVQQAHGMTGCLFWDLGPLEDNAFVLLKMAGGALASLHASWTQWRNRFCFELYGTEGFLRVDGLGGSYGEETLTVGRRRRGGSVPDEELHRFPASTEPWRADWNDFLEALEHSRPPAASAQDAVAVMALVSQIYAPGKAGTNHRKGVEQHQTAPLRRRERP
jgi:predicted dehydrogenase